MRRLSVRVLLLALLAATVYAQDCTDRLEMIIALDSSPSVQYLKDTNWDLQIAFAKAVKDKLDLGPDKSRVSFVRFDDEAAVEMPLEMGDSAKQAETYLDILLQRKNRYTGPWTDMDAAIKAISSEFKRSDLQGNRQGFKKVLLFITDGEANIKTNNLVSDMQKLKVLQGVEVICISITRIEDEERMFLNRLSSEGRNPYPIEDNSTVDRIFFDLARVCLQRDIVEPDNCFQNSGAGDIVFILDSSGSITKNGETMVNWDLAKTFLANLAGRLKDGAKDSHMALIEFSDTSRTRIIYDLADRDSVEMRDTILGLENIGSTTDTTTALKLATKLLRGYGNQPGVPDVVILLTDGYTSVNMGSAIPIAEQLHRERVTVFCVGITDRVKIEELAAISSPPHRFGENFWVTPGFDTLNSLVGSLYDRVCNIVPPSPQPAGPVDVCFIMDISGSITYYDESNFYDMLEFVKNIIFSFEIGLAETRVALITFSTNATLQFDLDDYDNTADISAHIDSLKNEKGKTNIAAGLRMARTQVFVPSGGHRENARGVIFLLTDGKDTQNSDYWREAQRLQAQGIEIFAVGVTDNVDMNQLYVIASNPKPDHVFTALNYNFLGNIVGEVLGGVDNGTMTTSSPEPTTPTTYQPPQAPSRTGSGEDGDLFGQAQPGVMSSMGCKNPADLLLIIDVSSAMTPSDVELAKQLVAAVVMASTAGPDQVNIEVMTVGGQVNRIVRFNEALSKEAILGRLDRISRQGGTKDLAELLRLVSDDVFDKGSAERILYPNLVLFLMAGSSKSQEDTIRQASLLRQHAIHMVVLGMSSDVNMAEAFAIASYPQTFNFRPNVVDVIRTPDGLQRSAAALVDILCNNVNECQGSPCMYNGTCIDTIDAFSCQCTKGRGGARCTGECTGAKDVVVAIDEAALQSPEDALSVFQWAQGLIDELPAGVRDTHLSLVTLNRNNVTVHFKLNQFLTKIQRLHAVPVPSYAAPWVDLDLALQFIDDNVFTVANGDRASADNMVILVTNGNTTTNTRTTRRPSGTRVIVVAQRKYARWHKLETIATDPVEANLITSDDFPYMTRNLADTVSRICDNGGVCKGDPCGNRGSCISMRDEFICKCHPPYSGVTCQEQPASQCQLDLVAIIDVSGRQSSQRLDDVKRFITGVIENFDVSPDGTRVGLITFSENATTRLSLARPVGKAEVLKEIDSVVWEGNDSNLMEGLRRVVMDMTRHTRPLADKVILLFSDGAPTIKGPQALDEALYVKLEGWRLMVFSVGSDLDPVKIRSLASHPVQNNAIILDDWMKLPSKRQWVSQQVCHSINSCEAKPCQNDGTCERVWDSHICHCPQSFAGANCQKRCTLPLRYDVALLADESAGNNPRIHWRMLTVIWTLIDALSFGDDATHLAFATFSNYTSPRWSLGQRNSKRHLLDLVSLGKNSAFSDSMDALRTAKTHMFTASQGNRADVNNVIIMLVDASHRVEDGAEGNVLSDLRDADYETMTVFIVAFGKNVHQNPNLAKLASATSKPYFTQVESDDDVTSAVDVIINALCSPVN